MNSTRRRLHQMWTCSSWVKAISWGREVDAPLVNQCAVRISQIFHPLSITHMCFLVGRKTRGSIAYRKLAIEKLGALWVATLTLNPSFGLGAVPMSPRIATTLSIGNAELHLSGFRCPVLNFPSRLLHAHCVGYAVIFGAIFISSANICLQTFLSLLTAPRSRGFTSQ